jgi:hypothetical protein
VEVEDKHDVKDVDEKYAACNNTNFSKNDHDQKLIGTASTRACPPSLVYSSVLCDVGIVSFNYAYICGKWRSLLFVSLVPVSTS